MKMQQWTVVLCVALAGCASGAQKNGKDAKLVGARAPLIGDGMTEAVYFIQLDNRELRNIFNQYPASISVSAGTHMVTAICEWRTAANETPVAKHVRRFRMEIIAGRTYQFKSSFEGAGTCQLSYEDETDQKPAVTSQPSTITR